MTEANDCPFCNGTETWVVTVPFFEYQYMKNERKYKKMPKSESYVMCMNCKAKGPITNTREEAIHRWNAVEVCIAGKVCLDMATELQKCKE